MISLATSKITPDVRANVNEALDDNRIAQGKFIKRFEEKVAKFHGVKHGIAVANGTIADIVGLAALKALRPEKTQVIVPALTFIAQTNAIIACGLEPVFVDVGYDHQIDADQVEERIGEDTLAIMATNLLGISCDSDKLVRLAAKHNVFLMEDSCEAYGIPPRGDLSTYSFFPSHTITTGEGGMVLTDNQEIADACRAAMNHGRYKDGILNKFHFATFGINGKMTNLQAAVGCAIVETGQDVIDQRRKNVELYNKWCNKDWYSDSPHCYPVMYRTTEARDSTLLRLEKNNVEARKLFSCLPTQEKVYEHMNYPAGSFPVAEDIGNRGLFVPIHQDLSKEDIDFIGDILCRG